jgi:hypothetical protein
VKLSIILFTSALAWAQSATTTYLTDLNGTRVAGTSYTTSKDGTKTETSQSVNGQQVPLEQSVDKVLREDSRGRVVERTIRKLDPTGQATSTERVVIEETKLSGGGSSVRSTTYRSDLNGNQQEAERKTVETRVQGSITTADTVIDRPNINGSFATTEKRTAVTEGTEAKGITTTESVYRPDINGGYHEALKSVKTIVKNGNQTTENTADYEPGVTGQLQLHAQSTSVSKKLPDGTDQTQVDLYSANVAGRLYDSSAPMQIKEEQIIERRTNPDGSVTETLSVRRPTVSDSSHLGDLQKLSETVCTGKCGADKPATPTPTISVGNSRP